MRNSLKSRLAIAIIAALPSQALSQRLEYHVGSPGPEDLRAMPEARCIWATDYSRTYRFVRNMERGMKAAALQAEFSALSEPCADKRANPRGDTLSAIVQLLYPEVADCIQASAPKEFRAFHKKLARLHTYHPEVVAFFEKGFPAPLAAAANRCDSQLASPVGYSERSNFYDDAIHDGGSGGRKL